MLNQQDKQDILEAVVMGVVTQGGPSINEFGDCAYRGDGGRKCVVGLFIDDSNYHSSLECATVTDDNVRCALENSLFKLSFDDLNYFGSLQSAHDLAICIGPTSSKKADDAFWPAWHKQLKIVCDEYGLRFPEELI